MAPIGQAELSTPTAELPALDAESTGLARDCKAQAEQIRSVAIDRIGERVGGLTPELLSELDEALRLHLAL